jgi:UrcA family protein
MLKDSTMTRIQALLAITALTIATAAAAAPVPQSIAVEAADLDLGSDKGQRILAIRIHRAASALCKAQALESLPRNVRNERACIREAQASAEAAVKTLTAARDQASSGTGG